MRSQKICVLRRVFEPNREKIMVFETEDMGIEESIRTKGGENYGV